MTSKHSSTPLGEPGRLIINVLLRTPQTARESIAIFVYLSDSARIASAMPGTSSVDHGTRSLGRVVTRGKARSASRYYQVDLFVFRENVERVSQVFEIVRDDQLSRYLSTCIDQEFRKAVAGRVSLRGPSVTDGYYKCSHRYKNVTPLWLRSFPGHAFDGCRSRST